MLALVERAHDDSKRAVADLRNLVRGIHPAVLTDRGLDAAVSALAARSPISVEVNISLPDAPAGNRRISRLLRHRRSTDERGEAQRRVRCARRRQHRRRSVEGRGPDDGVGGADVEHGGGLAGLASRVAAIEGRLRSPVRLVDRPRCLPNFHYRSAASGPRPTRRHRERILPMRIVIVEDSVLLREGIARLLNESGHDVVGQLVDADALPPLWPSFAPIWSCSTSDCHRHSPTKGFEPPLRCAPLAIAANPGALAVRRGAVRNRAAGQRQPRSWLSVEGTRRRRRGLRRRLPAGCSRRHRARPGGRRPTPGSPASGPFDDLTPREREVLGLMAEGRSNSGIARHLVVSDGAVEKHISSIFPSSDWQRPTPNIAVCSLCCNTYSTAELAK